PDGRAKLHADIAHPIHSAAREQIQVSVAKAYTEEKERAKLPGYVCRYDDFDYDLDDTPSYGAMVAGDKPGSGYKLHGPHGTPSPSSASTRPADETTNVSRSRRDEFGAGL
ncbi:MAG: SpoVG family protein, partial [Gemmataceae bacterium]